MALATGSLVLAGTGFYWDVAVHIDRGRDPGPFGTPAHFPILIGLFGIFASGWLALVMARGRDAGRTGVRLTETWVVPTSGLVMMACGGFALLGFPLDDVWHATFGQDVTLWGPTHLIMLTGGQLMIPTILGLLLEGRAATGERADTGVASRDGAGARWGARAIALSGAGGVLAGLTIYQDEFANGVPQYNLLFQPALLAFTAALALVFGRAVCGRGGALGAAAFNIAVSGLFTIVVGPVLGQALPHFSTYLAAALAVEVAGLLVSPKRSLAGFTALAALLVATLGTLGEWGWSHLWMPIPWPGHFVPSAIAISVPAAAAGALVGAFVAGTLAPSRIGRLGSTRWGAGAVGAVGFAALMAFCLPTHTPAHASATVTLDRAPGRPDAHWRRSRSIRRAWSPSPTTCSSSPGRATRGAWWRTSAGWGRASTERPSRCRSPAAGSRSSGSGRGGCAPTSRCTCPPIPPSRRRSSPPRRTSPGRSSPTTH